MSLYFWTLQKQYLKQKEHAITKMVESYPFRVHHQSKEMTTRPNLTTRLRNVKSESGSMEMYRFDAVH